MRDGNANPLPLSPPRHPSTSLPFTHKAGTVARESHSFDGELPNGAGAVSSRDDSEQQNLARVSGGAAAAAEIEFSFRVTSHRQARVVLLVRVAPSRGRLE